MKKIFNIRLNQHTRYLSDICQLKESTVGKTDTRSSDCSNHFHFSLLCRPPGVAHDHTLFVGQASEQSQIPPAPQIHVAISCILTRVTFIDPEYCFCAFHPSQTTI